MNISEIFNKFDQKYGNADLYNDSKITQHLTVGIRLNLKNKNNSKNENYYKAKFIFGLIESKFYEKDLIGTEIFFPKGNKSSTDLKIDCVIFKNNDWYKHYLNWHTKKNFNSLEWLYKNIICCIEFKNEDSKDIESVFARQLKPAIKIIESFFAVGIIFDRDRLYIFKKKGEKIIRYNDSYNEKLDDSKPTELNLELTDSYLTLPSHEDLKKSIDKDYFLKISNKKIEDLEIISKIQTTQMNNSLSNILIATERNGYKDLKGYEILIQVLALKIYDEKFNSQSKLQFYIEENEFNFKSLNDDNIQSFLKRFTKLINDTKKKYVTIFDETKIDLSSESIVNILVSIVKEFQIYSFIRSTNTDLYQLIFYKFASEFSKVDKKQFTTPLKIIDFMVKIINPKKNETIIDPTCGIGDFLSSAYVNSRMQLDDNNIFGTDNDRQMIELAQLNMLLNGDGNAKLKFLDGEGAIFKKFNEKEEIVELLPNLHKNGNWDNWNDRTQLKKFDIVLTNPPFGKHRSFQPKTSVQKEKAEIYELWNIARDGSSLDKGLIFLENTVRILKENGRFGIVLSNSLASVETWNNARKWLYENIRIVALFDLPANVFADTGVNTTLIFGYKPSKKNLYHLLKANYEIFVKDIKKVGYEVVTNNKVKEFVNKFKLDFKTLEVAQDNQGNPVVDEEFSEIIEEFHKWKLQQESNLVEIF